MPLVAHRPLESLQRIQKEGQEVLDIRRAHSQDIRELHIGLLNMMPDGALQATERQFLRLIGNSNRIAQFYVHIFTIEGVPRSPEMQAYIDENYEKFSDLAEQGLDALIVTGTNPVHQHLSDEPYVDEIRKIFRWADDNVTSVVCSCLASHAAFEIFYGIKRQPFAQKLFGVLEHRVFDNKHLLLSNINIRCQRGANASARLESLGGGKRKRRCLSYFARRFPPNLSTGASRIRCAKLIERIST